MLLAFQKILCLILCFQGMNFEIFFFLVLCFQNHLFVLFWNADEPTDSYVTLDQRVLFLEHFICFSKFYVFWVVELNFSTYHDRITLGLRSGEKYTPV
jgi:hypothetical protein